tara:strand:- start:56 stop:664 length:609 start_codon:yes stop_codon:yes gene_type:complete
MTNPSYVSLVLSKAATAADLTTADDDDIQLWSLRGFLGVKKEPKDENLWAAGRYQLQMSKLSSNNESGRLTDSCLTDTFQKSQLPYVIEEMEDKGYENYLQTQLWFFFNTLLEGESYKEFYKYTIYDNDAKKTLFEAFDTVLNVLMDKDKTGAKYVRQLQFLVAFQTQFGRHYDEWKLIAKAEENELLDIKEERDILEHWFR